mmetsp:Transcript_100706/g.284005  ORF Transcript_100706/g.284005 Transcript_100706/m.284005 type:complete len:437 (-) Transcript_100706:31-1341(-)
MAALLSWAVCLATSSRAIAFIVALDTQAIVELFRKFTILELPSEGCPDGIGDAWDARCAHGLTKTVECRYMGFQYSMEWHFADFLRNNGQFLAENPSDALYVYFPHCVSQVYFTFRETYSMTHSAALAAAESEYLVPLLRWAHGTPLYERHGGRNFWTTFSMDLGRQDFPQSMTWLEKWSVGSLTGSERWLYDSGAFFRSQFDGGDGRNCWEEDTAPVTLANELRPARDFHVQDTVIFVPSRFAPAARSRNFDERPTLAFFAGSPNSCARREVLKRYVGKSGFDVSADILDSDAYQERMWTSRFCLVMCGSSHTNNVRLYDAITHGCVPVIISDDFHPPLDAWVPWVRLAVFLPTASIPHLDNILRLEVGETGRWRRFEHLVIGRGGDEDAQPERVGQELLFGGLSASGVFDWHGTRMVVFCFPTGACVTSCDGGR